MSESCSFGVPAQPPWEAALAALAQTQAWDAQ